MSKKRSSFPVKSTFGFVSSSSFKTSLFASPNIMFIVASSHGLLLGGKPPARAVAGCTRVASPPRTSNSRAQESNPHVPFSCQKGAFAPSRRLSALNRLAPIRSHFPQRGNRRGRSKMFHFRRFAAAPLHFAVRNRAASYLLRKYFGLPRQAPLAGAPRPKPRPI